MHYSSLLQAAALALLALGCSEPGPDDIDPSGGGAVGGGGTQADADLATPHVDASPDDASTAQTTCERVCSILHHCEYSKDYPACVQQCDEQLLSCTELEAEEVAGCAPNYLQCVAVEGCLDDIVCIDGWQENW
tara:strand:+ start:21856 stop:22257 length:402 start_codon:yes stop_codon:yes gene_type:complete